MSEPNTTELVDGLSEALGAIADSMAWKGDEHTVASALREIAWAIRTHARATMVAAGVIPEIVDDVMDR